MRRFAPLLLLPLVGCKPNPGSHLKHAPPAPVAMGWRTHFMPKAGFSIAFPESFKPIDTRDLAGPGGSSRTFAMLGASSDPEPGSESLCLAAMEGGQLAIAMIIRKDHKHNVNRSSEVQEVEEHLSEGAMKIVDRSEMDLPVGKASRIVSEFKSGGAALRTTGYVMVDGHYSYRMIFFGLSLDGSKAPTKQIMRTFRVTKLSPRN